MPGDDRFHVVARRAPDELVCAAQYLGIPHAERVVVVQVTCSPGRPVALKEQLYARIAAGIAGTTHFAADDVLVNLVETARENWSFGRGIAHYAVEDRERAAAAAS